MSQTERTRIETFIEEQFPAMSEELESLRQSHPERFERRMKRFAPEMRRLMEMLETNPDRARLMIAERRLDMRIRRLAMRFRGAENEGRKRELRTKLRSLVEQAFDRRHERRALEIEDLEARIAELKKRHRESGKQRDSIIERELQQYLDRANKPEKKRSEGE